MFEDLEKQEEDAYTWPEGSVLPESYAINEFGEVVDLAEVRGLLGNGLSADNAFSYLTEKELANVPENVRRKLALARMECDDPKFLGLVRKKVIAEITSEVARRMTRAVIDNVKKGKFKKDPFKTRLSLDSRRKAKKYKKDWVSYDSDDDTSGSDMIYRSGTLHSL